MGQNLGPGPQIGKSIFSVKYPIEQCSKPRLVDDKRDDTTQYIGDYTNTKEESLVTNQYHGMTNRF